LPPLPLADGLLADIQIERKNSLTHGLVLRMAFISAALNS
jgi:hypothetical protein